MAAGLRRLALLGWLLALPLAALAAEQRTFADAGSGRRALIAALKANDGPALVAIVGEKHKTLVVTGDAANDAAKRAEAAALLATFHTLDDSAPDRRVLLIGEQAWPFPIPLVRQGAAWRFATEEGIEEIVNRRIGGNERSAIRVLRAYVDAQRAYASRDRDGDGVLQYARKLTSAPGRFDGLYWPADAAQGRGTQPLRTADRAERGIPRRAREGRCLSRLPLPDPDPPGHERAGRRLQLPDQRAPDRRLRDGRVPEHATATVA